MRNVLLNE